MLFSFSLHDTRYQRHESIEHLVRTIRIKVHPKVRADSVVSIAPTVSKSSAASILQRL